VVLHGARDRNSRAPISGFDSPSRASRAICASSMPWAVRSSPPSRDWPVALATPADPSATRIGILANPLSPGYRDYPALLSDALTHLGLDAIRAEARDLAGLDNAFATIARAHVHAVLVTADPNFNRPVMRRRIIELAVAEKLAVISTVDAFTREGGLLSLGTDEVIRKAHGDRMRIKAELHGIWGIGAAKAICRSWVCADFAFFR